MRTCFYCKKPMHTSSCSVWIKGKTKKGKSLLNNVRNYDAHKKCIKLMTFKKLKEKENEN